MNAWGYRAVSGELFSDRAIRGSFHPGIWFRGYRAVAKTRGAYVAKKPKKMIEEPT